MNSTAAAQKRLFVIYFPDGYLGVAPTVLGFLGELTAAGHYVHVRGLATAYASAGTLPSTAHVATFLRLSDTPRGARLRSRLARSWLWSLLPFLELLWFVQQNFQLDREIPEAQRRLRRVDIGIDLQGTILAWCHCLYARTPYISVSLELPGTEPHLRFEKLVGWLERRALGGAVALTIQDEDRLRTLAARRSPVPSQVLYLPNSPPGAQTVAPPADNYFRRVLKIDRDRFPHIALLAGMILDDVYAQELATAFSQIDAGFALVFHERIKRSETEPYLQLLLSQNSRNLFLSLDPVPFDQVDGIYAAATVCLVYYRPVSENFAQIASASGKLTFSLKHGVPVIMNALPSLVAMNARYDFGAIVEDPGDPGELSAALEKIMSRYDVYSANARRCFREEYDFHAKFAPVRAMLESL